MNNNLSKEPLIFFIGKVVGFDEQEDQVKGGGWGWRYKVAIFDRDFLQKNLILMMPILNMRLQFLQTVMVLVEQIVVGL